MIKVKAVGERFWDLMEKSVLTSSVLAVALMGTACSLWWRGMAVPTELYALLYGVVGFFFLAKKARNGG